MGEDEEQIPSYLIESASIPSTIPEPEIMEAPEATKAQTLQTN